VCGVHESALISKVLGGAVGTGTDGLVNSSTMQQFRTDFPMCDGAQGKRCCIITMLMFVNLS
jgi:hypothetical protein